MDTGKLKESVAGEIDSRYGQLSDLSLKLHKNPEVAFEEHRASAWLAEYLEQNGFAVEKGICKLPTAFRATYGNGRPVIAFLAEYDALPGIGHGCGHNLIATSSVAAGIASCKAADVLGGSIIVFGTPGEESLGGKAVMAERGAFTDIDIAMIAHPGGGNTVVTKTLACETLTVEFQGKAAHAAAEPEVGINALEAMIQSFNAINSLRQHIRERARIHGIITDGGEAANIVPAHTAGYFFIRAEDDPYLDELKERVINCFAGAAKATGAKLKYRWGEHYAAMLNNMTMARLFKDNMQLLGRNIHLGGNTTVTFSTDAGNVSQLLPTIHPLVSIVTDDTLIHTLKFAEASASENALNCLLDAAKAMAMTVVDLLASPETVENVQEEFRKSR